MRLLFIPIALTVIIILTGAHYMVYMAFLVIFSFRNTSLLLLRFLVAFPMPAFILISISAMFYNNQFTRFFYTLLAGWLVFSLYLFFFAVALFVIRSIPGADYITLGRILLAVAIITSVYGIINARNIRVRSVEINSPAIASVWPEAKAVWISDLHLGQIHGRQFAEEIVNLVNKQNPDIVFIGGDLFDGIAVDLADVTEPFAELKPRLGTYFITGNHEEFSSPDKYIETVKAGGIKVLFNESVEISGVQLVGVDYKSASDNNLEKVLSKIGLDKNKPSILLKHAPTGLAIAEKFGFDLMISGHTHRAQMWPLTYLTDIIYKGYDRGLKSYGAMQVFTSTGTGTWGPPARVVSNPEIVIFKFK
jgi:hypothetical protein